VGLHLLGCLRAKGLSCPLVALFCRHQSHRFGVPKHPRSPPRRPTCALSKGEGGLPTLKGGLKALCPDPPCPPPRRPAQAVAPHAGKSKVAER
jgi:hypothetical protein